VSLKVVELGLRSRNQSGARLKGLFGKSIFAKALTVRWMLNYSADVDYSKIITIEPGKRNGKPCIRGMRITVQDVLEYLAGGMTEDQILSDFPELTREDINACFAFAADRERKLFVAPA
jgi:uncharacterized protein (DUF433 family)